MKNNVFIFLAAAAFAFLFGCVNVDDEVSETPSVYWKPPKGAMPSEYYLPSQIKTDTIESGKGAQGESVGSSSSNKNKAENSASDKAEKRGSENGQNASTVNGEGLPGSVAEKSAGAGVGLSASEKMLAGKTLDLPDLVDIALENNTSTRMYWFQAKQYAAAQGKAESSYYPQVSVGAQIYRSKTKPSLGYSMGIPIGAYYETAYGPSAEITWLLYDFGGREARVDSAREALRAANFEYNQALQDVFLNVKVAYYQYYAAVGGVKAAKLSLEDSKTSFEAATRKLNEGVGNKQDMLNALASLKNAEFEVESKIADVETARANLANAIGVGASDISSISEDVRIPKSPETAKKIDELIAKALRSRQSLLAGYAQLRKTKSDVVAAQRNFLPQIGAQGSATYMWYTGNGRSDQYQYQVGLTASWSIFEGFARKYDLISAKAAERAQAQQLKAEEIQIMSDVWAYYHVYQSALKQVASSEASVKASEEAYEATRIGFANGVNTVTDLLNSQSRLASARQTNVSALATLSTSIARLSHAVGAVSSLGKN